MALWNHRIERVLAAAERLPVNELHCLMQLFLEKPTSARALADLLGIRDSSLSKLLRKLEQRAAVIRGPDPADRRIEHVYLSESGARVAERTIARATEIGGKILAELPEERRGQFVRCLGVMTLIGSNIIALDTLYAEKPNPIPQHTA
jgi:DNA-binding MarR family transcriptional regulator